MSDIIQVLPDSVANQIAAGEVIQRPASVVKELVENAIDAGADDISIKIIDAGKTLIQVSDNGCGMSDTDARMCFERHATSKIKSASDLFAIRTMGFRGEALASIVAVADLTLKSKRTENEIGTTIHISGSKVNHQEETACPNGTTFTVKNLFYNVPARRKFLKSNSTELRHIITEIQRIVLPNPEIRFIFEHNNTTVYNLPKTNLRQRIVQVFGKSSNQNLVDIKVETSLVTIKGYIGKPEYAKKTFGEQFFFANNRFMRHPYFHKAVMNAYDKLLSPNTFPSYFIYFTVNPESIDINIHPTKTEIKFENEQAIFQILHASTKEALGKFNLMPSIDFDAENVIDIPIMKKGEQVTPPSVTVNPDYNPFSKDSEPLTKNFHRSPSEKANLQHWESLYGTEKTQTLLPDNHTDTLSTGKSYDLKCIQLKNKYILTPVKSGLMVIDQKRAHERILFETYLNTLNAKETIAQQSLYPQTIELSSNDHAILLEILNEVNRLGFDIRDIGNNSVIMNAHPADSIHFEPKGLIEGFISNYTNEKTDIASDLNEKLAVSLARASVIHSGQPLSQEEIRELFDRLFACKQPHYTYNGKPIITIIKLDEIEKKLK